MRYRQIHLDFHTSPDIPAVGEKFDKHHWQSLLQEACVDSITCFSLCHHGMSYHPTKIGTMHPNLKFNLLRAQIDACHEIGVNVPMYLSAGLNEAKFQERPDWMSIDFEGRYAGWSRSNLMPGYHHLCFNTAYLDFLCEMLAEAVQMFPDADGVFLDITTQLQCCCPKCTRDMWKQGLNPEKEEDRKFFAHQVLMNYYKRTYETVKSISPNMPIYHNGVSDLHDLERLKYFSHYEVESLPTAFWGYDHFPMNAAWLRRRNMEFLGMTGKFHTAWGEFGGFKHPNALRYECAAMLANGARCSVGDQLHPSGKLDASTYRLIAPAYREVKEREPWCEGSMSAAEIAVLGASVFGQGIRRSAPQDEGVSRFLLEEHLPFDLICPDDDLSDFRLLIVPEVKELPANVVAKIRQFVANGGKLLLSGVSALGADGKAQFDIGGEIEGCSEFSPDYIQANEGFADNLPTSPFLSYGASLRFKVKDGISIGKVYDPYFQRNARHFSSHRQTPFSNEETGYSAGSLKGNILYFAHDVFTLYRTAGATTLKYFMRNALRKLLGDEIPLRSSLPSTARFFLRRQEKESRYIAHFLYAPTILRGGQVTKEDGTTMGFDKLEIIEDLPPCPASDIDLRIARPVKSLRLVPEGTELQFTQTGDRLHFTLPAFICQAIVEIKE